MAPHCVYSNNEGEGVNVTFTEGITYGGLTNPIAINVPGTLPSDVSIYTTGYSCIVID